MNKRLPKHDEVVNLEDTHFKANDNLITKQEVFFVGIFRCASSCDFTAMVKDSCADLTLLFMQLNFKRLASLNFKLTTFMA